MTEKTPLVRVEHLQTLAPLFCGVGQALAAGGLTKERCCELMRSEVGSNVCSAAFMCRAKNCLSCPNLQEPARATPRFKGYGWGIARDKVAIPFIIG